MAAADAAMYAAKGAGKNHVVINALAQPAYREAQPLGAG